MEATSIIHKVRRGIGWFPLHVGRSYHNSLDQLVVEVCRRDYLDEEHNFEPGKPVVFFTEEASGLLHYMKFTAQVSYVEEDRMVVALPSPDALLQVQRAERLGIQLTLDETTYRLMFEALDRVMEAKADRLAELRDICHTSAPIHRFTFLPQRFPWLNASQEQAVNEALWAKDVAVVHGPPGTGKTTTLVEAIYETLHRETQVMVCAQSNMAVDWIAEKLCDRGVSVLRIGNPTRVTDRMLEQQSHTRPLRRPSKGKPGAFPTEDCPTAGKGCGTGTEHPGGTLQRGSRHSLHPDGQCQPPAGRPPFRHTLHRRGSTGTRSGLLDSHPQSRPIHPGRRPPPAAAHAEMPRVAGRGAGQDAHATPCGAPATLCVSATRTIQDV